jgi:alpha-galactosidase
MPKITIVGAGGYVFPLRLAMDILSYPELQDAHFELYDVHAGRMKRTHERVSRVIAKNKLKAKATMTTDRRKALTKADYVIVAFQVGGVEAYAHDVDIPRRYGLDQCVGDTLGPGGVFRGLRSIGVFEDICRDMHAVAPDALILQYANPMAINCWAINEMGIKVVGLCHSVQGTSGMLVKRAGYNYDDISFKCAGINHQAWFTDFRDKDGADIYPKIRETMFKMNPSPFAKQKSGGSKRAKDLTQRGMDHNVDDEHYYFERVRTETMRTFGFFHTESSHHGSEYLPWYRKNAEMVNAYIAKRWDYYEISKSYQNVEQQDYLEEMINAPLKLSDEYGARIVHSMETDTKRVIYGNVPNYGAPGSDRRVSGAHIISNLPREGCVEVACLVDRNGIQPAAYGALPAQLAAINRTNMNVQELAVLGALSKSRDAVHQAIALDPLTGALLTLPQIHDMVEELFAAHKPWLPKYK